MNRQPRQFLSALAASLLTLLALAGDAAAQEGRAPAVGRAPSAADIVGRVNVVGDVVNPARFLVFRLHRKTEDCCRRCDPDPCTRRCCGIAATLVDTATLNADGEFVFQDVPPGDYLIVNNAGSEQSLKVKEKQRVVIPAPLRIEVRNAIVGPPTPS